VQRDGLKDGAQFVKPVGAFSEDIQAEIDFGERGNTDFGHALDYGLASLAVDFCATRCFDCESFFSSSATLSVSRSAGRERRHSARDFSHSAAAKSLRPVLA
jgi:hypothetical protein